MPFSLNSPKTGGWFGTKADRQIGVNKKLVETLKTGELSQETLEPCLSSFRSLIESNLSPDLLRSLALSITYALHKPKPPPNLQKKKSIRFAQASSRPGSSKSSDSDEYISAIALGTEMMRLYASILCNPIDPAPLKKFAKAVTNKVSRKQHQSQ